MQNQNYQEKSKSDKFDNIRTLGDHPSQNVRRIIFNSTNMRDGPTDPKLKNVATLTQERAKLPISRRRISRPINNRLEVKFEYEGVRRNPPLCRCNKSPFL